MTLKTSLKTSENQLFAAGVHLHRETFSPRVALFLTWVIAFTALQLPTAVLHAHAAPRPRPASIARPRAAHDTAAASLLVSSYYV